MPQTAAELVQEAFEGLPRDDPGWFDLGEECADLLTRAQRGADAVTVIDDLLVRYVFFRILEEQTGARERESVADRVAAVDVSASAAAQCVVLNASNPDVFRFAAC